MFRNALKFAPIVLIGLLAGLAAGFGVAKGEWEGGLMAVVVASIAVYLYRSNGGKWML